MGMREKGRQWSMSSVQAYSWLGKKSCLQSFVDVQDGFSSMGWEKGLAGVNVDSWPLVAHDNDTCFTVQKGAMRKNHRFMFRTQSA